MGKVHASMAAYVASQERQSRRTRTGLYAARAKGNKLGRPWRPTGEQITAIRQNLSDDMPVAVLDKSYFSPVIDTINVGKGCHGCPPITARRTSDAISIRD